MCPQTPIVVATTPGRKPELAHFGLAQPEFGLVVGDFPNFAKKPEKGVANCLQTWIITLTVNFQTGQKRSRANGYNHHSNLSRSWFLRFHKLRSCF
jgi:hypothetical protein